MAEVSVITPMYNAANYLAETAASVRAQTFTDWEWWIVDDCSSDNSYALAQQLAAADSRIHVLQNEKNIGQAWSRKAGVDRATGRYICYIDADDLWHAEKLAKQVAFMKDKACSFSFTAYKHFAADIHEHAKVIHAPAMVDYAGLLRMNSIGCLTIMYDAKQLGKQWREPVMRENDYLLWLGILKTGACAYGLNEVLAYYRTGHMSVSKNKLKVSRYYWGIIRHNEKLPLLKAAFYFVRYAILGVLKHYTP